jgi:hypothetical protein
MIELRDAKFCDHIAIARLHAQNWRQNYRGILSDNFLNLEVEKDRLNVWFERLQFPANNQQITVAIHNENIIGFSCLFFNDDPVFGSLLDNLHVAKNMQQHGIGKMLIKNCTKTILHPIQ